MHYCISIYILSFLLSYWHLTFRLNFIYKGENLYIDYGVNSSNHNKYTCPKTSHGDK